jgi:hypothetical protein
MHTMPLESSKWLRCHNSVRMLKKAVQQGRSEREEARLPPGVRAASERRENAAW